MKRKIIVNELPVLMVILSILQICFMIVQIAYSVLVYSRTITDKGLYEGGYIAFIIIAVFIINLFILRNVMRTIKTSYTLIHDQAETIKNIEALNNNIRSQRHDFLNHIQVLYSMVELEEYDEVRKYLQNLYGKIETTNFFLKTRVVAVNALLQAKYSHALSKDIPFHMDIGTQLLDTPISDWDMCRLLGNLIDNALYASEKYTGEKKVQVGLNETINAFIFSVSNNGEPISSVHMDKLFDPGYTTKKEHGEGMGLFIVKQIADAHQGSVHINTSANKTEFVVTIPKYTIPGKR